MPSFCSVCPLTVIFTFAIAGTIAQVFPPKLHKNVTSPGVRGVMTQAVSGIANTTANDTRERRFMCVASGSRLDDIAPLSFRRQRLLHGRSNVTARARNARIVELRRRAQERIGGRARSTGRARA